MKIDLEAWQVPHQIVGFYLSTETMKCHKRLRRWIQQTLNRLLLHQLVHLNCFLNQPLSQSSGSFSFTEFEA